MKRAWRWLTVAVLLCSGALVGEWLSYQNRPLLQRATRLGAGGGAIYVWRSPTEILRFETHSGRQVSGGELQDLVGHRLDVGSAKETPLRLLGGRMPAEEAPDIYSMSVSPDAKWLLYATQYLPSSEWSLARGFRAVEIGGDRTYVCHACDPYADHPQLRPVWLPDSRRWLELEPDSSAKLLLHSLDANARHPIDLWAGHTAAALLGVTPKYRLITNARGQALGTSKAELVDIGLHPSLAPRRRWTISAPRGGAIKELALSPRGDRLAWLVTITHYPLGSGFLSRWFPSISRRLHASQGVEVRTSRLDGSESRLIGFQASDSRLKGHDDPWALRWRPDGKAVSFNVATQLYQVPVE